MDFLIITALEEEREAVLRKLAGYQKAEKGSAEVFTYYLAYLPTKRKLTEGYRIGVTCLAGMGPIEAAVRAIAAVNQHRPRHVIVVGIAGGLCEKTHLGDVMVGTQIVDYTLGKTESGKRTERWVDMPADASLLDAAVNFRVNGGMPQRSRILFLCCSRGSLRA
jgi:nucleoside phosphorylase